MDGTLLDSEKLWDVSLEALAEHLGGTLSTEGREAMVGSNMAHSLTILFDDLGLSYTPDDLVSAREWLRAKTAELFDAGLVWRPGARAALDMVARSGMPMALVTNTERYLTERALGTLGRDRFAAIVCGDEVKLGKPHPEPYEKAAELLGLRPVDCLAIEDSPTGAAAAEAAGATVLVIPCAVAVPAGPRRVQRHSLEGITLDEMRAIWTPR